MPLKVAVLGPIPFDRVTTHRGDVLEKYGCALYTVAALSAFEPLFFDPDGTRGLPPLVGDGSPHDWLISGAGYLLRAQAAVTTLLWGLWWIRTR